MQINGKEILTNADGYLRKLADWDQDIAAIIAHTEGINLTPDHWLVVNFLRSFYLQYQMTPALRIMVKQLTTELSADKANSIYLQSLFPGGIFKQGSKIAGLPKPVRCI